MKELRYLTQEEKDKTRSLWEAIFPEDEGAFLDYYYSVKTKDNEIAAVEIDGQIRSMLQLNPYCLKIGHTSAECAYVIAVATEENYRHRGLMRELLLKTMSDRYAKKQPFMFLIPANEDIYKPFGFRFVMEQYHREVSPGREGSYRLEVVSEADREMAAAFANDVLAARADVYAIRDAEYYRVLSQEALSEEGDVCWIVNASGEFPEAVERVGILSYTAGDAVEIREPLLKPEYEGELEDILRNCFPEQKIRAFGLMPLSGPETKPTIMMRLLYLPALFEGVRATEDLVFVLRIHDNMIPENNGDFVWHVNEKESNLDAERTPGRKDTDLDVSIEALTRLLMGSKHIDEIIRSEHCIMTQRAREKWSKLSLLHRVFLNEVV